MKKKELEERCKTLEDRCKTLEKIFKDISWMSWNYAHGRKSCAVGVYNDAVKKAQEMGIDIKPDTTTGLIEAKDGVFDKEWFKEFEKLKFIPDARGCGHSTQDKYIWKRTGKMGCRECDHIRKYGYETCDDEDAC